MKLEVGMYVRTKYGYIAKITKINPSSIYFDSQIFYASNFCAAHNKILRKENIEKIAKANHDIKKLIQYGDYVNGFKVIEFDDIDGDGNEYIELGIPVYEDACLDVISEYRPLSTIDIKTIVTKERFESMAYKVVE